MATISRSRLQAELRALAERFPEVRPLSPDHEAPSFEGPLAVDGRVRHVRMVLSPGYPSIPPEVREIEGPGGAVRARVGAHNRFADGSLCLFPHGNDPQGWQPARMAADALDRAVTLLRREAAETASGAMYAANERLIVPPGAAQVMEIPGGRGILRLCRGKSGAGDLLVAEAVEETSGLRVPGLDPRWEAMMAPAGEASWVAVPPDAGPWRELFSDGASLRAWLTQALPAPLAARACAAEVLVLVRGDGDRVALTRRADWVGALFVSRVVVATADELLFRRADAVLGARDRLGEVQVVMVGLGSLGSAAAVALARAGCRRFLLIDPDRLTIENISRHAGTVLALGAFKVEAVAATIRAINPGAEVEVITTWLAWDRRGFGAGLAFEQALARPLRSLVVTTCAVGRVERQINAVAVPRGTPAIYAAALGAAEHGRVFRVVPGESACYECVRLAQERSPERFPSFGVEGGGEPYVDPTLPGLAIDIGQIALITARLALQTLARVHGVELAIADEVGDHLLWTNRGGWGFDRPLQVEVVRVPRAEDCPVCGRGADEGLDGRSTAKG
jgi:molybdopterin/thiamine biosynthesis adenylyltransferase